MVTGGTVVCSLQRRARGVKYKKGFSTALIKITINEKRQEILRIPGIFHWNLRKRKAVSTCMWLPLIEANSEER